MLLAHPDTVHYARATHILMQHFLGADLIRIEKFFYCGKMLTGVAKVYAFEGHPENVCRYRFSILAEDLSIGCLSHIEKVHG